MKYMLLAIALFLQYINTSYALPETIIVSGSAFSAPSRVVLNWTNNVGGDTYRIYRKLIDEKAWELQAELTNNPTSWIDYNVSTGLLAQYAIVRRKYEQIVPFPVWRYVFDKGYASVSVGELPAINDRGTVLIVIDDRFIDALAPEIQRFCDDLTGDSWSVIKTNFTGGLHLFSKYYSDLGYSDYNSGNSSISSAPTDATWKAKVVELKGLIRSVQTNYPALNSVILLGHLPVPYSGTQIGRYDGHGIYEAGAPFIKTFGNAFPADLYYADLTSGFTWSDTISAPPDSGTGYYPYYMEERNDAGDGRFDADYFTGVPDVAIGRIDFFHLNTFVHGADVSSFTLWPLLNDETREKELLRRYLNKEHKFRTGSKLYAKRAITQSSGAVETGFNAYLNYEGPFSKVVEPSNVDSNFTWYEAGLTNTYLLGGWAGNAWWQTNTYYPVFQENHSGDNWFGSAEFVLSDVQVVFQMMRKSFLAEWALPFSYLRASLAGLDGLCNFYSLPQNGTGTDQFVRMAMGNTIGEGFIDLTYQYWPPNASLSNSNLWLDYVVSQGSLVGVSLLGDPTLRLHIIPSPSDVRAIRQSSTDIVSWAGSTGGSVLGYDVLYGLSRNGPFTSSLTTYLPANATSYTNSSTNLYYQVRAVGRETTSGLGTYTNTSLGILNKLRFRDALLNGAGTQMTFELVGPAGLTLSVESSTDFSNWSTVESLVLTNGSISKTYSSTSSHEFFRARGTNDAIHYSDNVIAYYHIDLPAGSNQLALVGMQVKQFGANANTLNRLIPPSSLPNGTKVYTVNSATGAYDTTTAVLGTWNAGNRVIDPGEGFWLSKGGGTGAIGMSVCGEVPQGNFRHRIPLAWGLYASLRPNHGNVGDMMSMFSGAANGDKVYRFNYSTQAYYTPVGFFASIPLWTPTQTVAFGEGFLVDLAATSNINWDEACSAWTDLE